MEDNNYWKVIVVELEPSDSGRVRKISREYLVSAVNATDAEVKMNKEYEGRSDFYVKGITLSKVIRVVE